MTHPHDSAGSRAASTPAPTGQLNAGTTAVLRDERVDTVSAAASPKPPDAGAASRSILTALAHPLLAIPLIVSIGLLLFIVNLGGYPLYTKGEPREAVTIFDIVHGGGIILPLRAGVEIPSKPLLMHWLAALLSLATGVINEWTVRLPSATFACAGILLCYLYVRRLFDQRAALIAALIMGTSFQYLQAGTGARVDMTLTFFLEIALFEFLAIAEGLRQRTEPLYFAIAFAILTKGPIGGFIPLMVAALWLILSRRWDLLPRLKLARGALIVGLIGGGWYLAAIIAGGADFVHKQILAENFYRLFHHRGFYEGHAHPFYYEDAALLAGFMPWSPLALLAAILYLRRPRPLDARVGYLLLWFSAVLIFYNLPQSKRGIYLLALYPALSALVAIMICAWLDTPAVGARGLRILARLTGACFAITGAAALIALLLLGLLPAPIRWMILDAFDIRAAGLVPQLRLAVSDHLIASIVLPLATFAIGARLLRSPPRIDRLLLTTTAAMVAITLAVNLVVGVAIANTLALKDFAADTIRLAGNEPLGYFGSLDYSFAFYSGRNIHFISGRDADLPPFIVATEDGLKLLPTAILAHYIVVLRSNPTDLDGTGTMYLLKRTDKQPPLAPPTPPSSSTKQYEL